MNFTVVGAGAWGTAIALHLLRAKHTVTIVPRRFEQALSLASAHENIDYLPGYALPLDLQIGHELTPVLMEADIILLACPAQALRATCTQIVANLGLATRLRLVINLSKGLENGTFKRPSEIVREIFPPQYAVGTLSGPTNAQEVAAGRPAAMVLAADGADAEYLAEVQAALSGKSLRIYLGNDLAGVEYGGSLKNIYAIAAGCCDGLKLGDNAKAALLTRALAEMLRVGAALGAKPETFYGLGGFGDLVATSSGNWSRNRTFGQHLGEGKKAADLIADSKSVVEGYTTTKSFYGLCQSRKIEAPILAEVFRILYEGRAPAEALDALMTRDLKHE